MKTFVVETSYYETTHAVRTAQCNSQIMNIVPLFYANVITNAHMHCKGYPQWRPCQQSRYSFIHLPKSLYLSWQNTFEGLICSETVLGKVVGWMEIWLKSKSMYIQCKQTSQFLSGFDEEQNWSTAQCEHVLRCSDSEASSYGSWLVHVPFQLMIRNLCNSRLCGIQDLSST